ncbi:MAG: GNAT family N-acetyltransferase [Boseongicola sp. SB0673_bin_14]|nr:GNAT family N-acetyltransferase [Boseongicola sp. SB0667_bin_21]MYI67782.1 GNAT family N-acetyltransferase [Boseongicola sp. SB0673_bin_14]
MQDTPDGGDFKIRPLAPSDPRARRLIGMLDRLQLSLYPAESNHLESIDSLEHDDAAFLVALVAGEVVGCGAVKRMPASLTSPRYGETRRMYVDSEVRGRGIGGALLDALESNLISHGIVIARLETGVCQPDAHALYEGHGYVRISPFGDYVEDPLSVFHEKWLA